MFGKKKIGVALGGGGIRGLAHIGVLRILEDYKIPIDMISGTSIGALIGAIYSSEPNAKKLEKDVLNENIGKLLDYTLSKYGIIKGNKIEEYVKRKLNDTDFKDLKIPLYVTAYDINKKREIIFSKGEVSKAVHASISIPGLFIPVENNNRILVDAGMVDPIPTEVLRKNGADIIIAINVNDVKEKSPVYTEIASSKKGNKMSLSMLQNTMKSLEIIGSEVAKADLLGNKADFIININLEDIGILDYKKAKKAISAGKREAKKSLLGLKNKIEPNPFKAFIEELNNADLNVKNKVKKIVKNVKKIAKN